jgi:hypothetical protein
MARDATLEKYLAIVRRMQNYFRGFTVEYVETTKNTKVDELAKAATKKQHYPQMCFSKPSKTPQ